MGSLWEPYGKRVPFLGAPGNSFDFRQVTMKMTKMRALVVGCSGVAVEADCFCAVDRIVEKNMGLWAFGMSLREVWRTQKN